MQTTQTRVRRIRAVIGISLLVSVVATPSDALVGLVGSCGNPTGTVGNASDPISATDALAVLQGGVGLIGCVGLICDVNDSGAVSSTDALLVLQIGVGLPGTVVCPTEADEFNCPPESCPCSGDELVALFENINDPSATTRLQATPNVALLIKCNELVVPEPTEADPLEILVSDIAWRVGISRIAASEQLLSATGQHVIFKLDTPCYERCLGICNGGTRNGLQCTQNRECGRTCTVGGVGCNTNVDCTGGADICTGPTCSVAAIDTCTNNTECNAGISCSNTTCPNIDSAGRRFLELAGNNILVEGLHVRGFFEGIEITGLNNTVSDMTLERNCDDSVTNGGSGLGNEVRDSIIMSGCDKCTQDAGNNANIDDDCDINHVVTPDSLRECYHLAYHGVHFNGCGKPIRWNGGGTFLVKDSQVENGMFACKMLEMGSNPPVRARFQNTLIENCEGGIIVGGNDLGNRVVFDGNAIQDNEKRGVMVRRMATGTLRRNLIESNGSSAASESDMFFKYYGGVSAAGEDGDNPTVNLGNIADSSGDQSCDVCTTNNPPPEGCNRICNNAGHTNAENAPTFGGGAMEVHNGEATQLIAENNWWCSTPGNGPPPGELVGMITNPVDVEPALLCDPTN